MRLFQSFLSLSILCLSCRQTTATFYNCSGATTTRRKEVRQMKADGDWAAFVRAFQTVQSKGILESFVDLHSPSEYWSYAHNSSLFLLFYRVYIRKFERALQDEGAAYLPYWNWYSTPNLQRPLSIHRAIDALNPWRSPVLSKDFFGRYAF